MALKQSIELLVDGQDALTPNGIEETETSFRHDRPGLTWALCHNVNIKCYNDTGTTKPLKKSVQH